MKRMKNRFIYLLLAVVTFVGCDISDNEIEPDQTFLKIYDNDQFQSSYIPLDVKQTSDGGYLILSGRRIDDSDFIGISVYKVDETGAMVRGQDIATDFVHPVQNLMAIDGSYYFVGMSSVNLRAFLFTVNEQGEVSDPAPIAGLEYPLYTKRDGSDIILLSYDNFDKNSVLSVVNTSAEIRNNLSQNYSIGAGVDVEAPIIEHFTRTGKQLPFSAGVTSNGTYFFNGFYNYTMSLVFTDLSSGDVEGVTQGQQEDGGISAVSYIQGEDFAVSRYNFGDNFIVPRVTLQTTGTTSSTDLLGNSFPELVPDAHIVIKPVTVNQQSYQVYGSHTKSGQIVLHAFETQSGELQGTKYFGFTSPYEFSSFEPTEDGGLVIIGTTYVAGRFGRICLIKLTPEEVQELVGL